MKETDLNEIIHAELVDAVWEGRLPADFLIPRAYASDARALWAYRVLARAEAQQIGFTADEAQVIKDATALVAADPSLDPDAT